MWECVRFKPQAGYSALPRKKPKPLYSPWKVDDKEGVVDRVAAIAPAPVSTPIRPEIHCPIAKAHAHVAVAPMVGKGQHAYGARLVKAAPHAPTPLAKEFVVGCQHDERKPRGVLRAWNPCIGVDITRNSTRL